MLKQTIFDRAFSVIYTREASDFGCPFAAVRQASLVKSSSQRLCSSEISPDLPTLPPTTPKRDPHSMANPIRRSRLCAVGHHRGIHHRGIRKAAVSVLLQLSLVCISLAAAQWVHADQPAAPSQTTPTTSPQTAVANGGEGQRTLQSVLQRGAELETQSNWGQAARWYEKASREFPESQQVAQRLIICKLHGDIIRRYKDSSFVQSVRTNNASEALDLYSEVLVNLETHYVDRLDLARVLLHGTASLEIALEEAGFVNQNLAEQSRERIQQFQQTIHQRIVNRPTTSRAELRQTVSMVASLAQQELSLNPTAVVLEYVGGAMCTLDQYTRLLSGDQLDDMFSNIEGNFVGLGVELEADTDSLKILSVIPGGPADQAGLKAGERIVRVDHAETGTTDPSVAADLLRGPEHSNVSICLLSVDGSKRDMTIQRRRVDVPCVENVHIVDQEHGVGYLRLTNFQKTTKREIEQALWALHQKGMQSLILDVRGNPGGLLTAAVDVADRFLGQGKIVTTRGRNVRENFDYVAHRTNTWNGPLAVLIDDNSASASEIFAGAIHDSQRGVLVGKRSYGKGSVQGIFRMQSAKFGLCVTTAKFYSPNGTAISYNGVNPHVTVESKYIAARPDAEGQIVSDQRDEVLQSALAQLQQHRVAGQPR